MHSIAQLHTHEAASWNTMAERYGTRATLATTLDATSLLQPPIPTKQTLDRDVLEAALDRMSDSGCAAVPNLECLAASLHRASICHHCMMSHSPSYSSSCSVGQQKYTYRLRSVDA